MMTSKWLSALAVLVAAVTVAGIIIGWTGSDERASGDAWLGFLGSLIAAAGTIFAGYLAWAAVQRQIANENRTENFARLAVRAEIEDALKDINYIWEIIDLALDTKGGADKTHGLETHAINSLHLLSNSIKIEDFRAAGSGLNPVDILHYREVIRQLERILKQIDEREPAEDPKRNYWRVVNMRTQFSHLYRYLIAFDAASVDVFAGRRRTQTDHRSQAEQLEQLLQEIRAMAETPEA